MTDRWHGGSKGRQWKERDAFKDDWERRHDTGSWQGGEWQERSASSRGQDWQHYGGRANEAWSSGYRESNYAKETDARPGDEPWEGRQDTRDVRAKCVLTAAPGKTSERREEGTLTQARKSRKTHETEAEPWSWAFEARYKKQCAYNKKTL